MKLFVVLEFDCCREDEGGSLSLKTQPWNFSDFRVGGCAVTKARLKPGESTTVDGRTFANAGEVPGVGLVGLEEVVPKPVSYERRAPMSFRIVVFGDDGEEVDYRTGVVPCYDLDGLQFAALWAASENFAPLRVWCEEVIGRQEAPDEQVMTALNHGREVEPVLARLERLHVLYGCPLPGHWERLDSAGIRLPKYTPAQARLPRRKTWVLNGAEVYTSREWSTGPQFRLEAGTWERDHWAEYQWSHR